MITIYRYNEDEGVDDNGVLWVAFDAVAGVDECDNCHNLMPTNIAWMDDNDGYNEWMYCENCVELDDSQWDN